MPLVRTEIVLGWGRMRLVAEMLNGNFTIKKNVELWDLLMREKEKFKDIKFLWLKGHDKDRDNNDVDRRAVEEAKKVRG